MDNDDVTVTHPSLLTGAEARTCGRLTFRGEGYMQSALSAVRRDPRGDDYVLRVLDPEDGLLLGWALVFRSCACDCLVYQDNRPHPTRADSDQNFYQVHVYVRRSHRRQGIGARLLRVANGLVMPRALVGMPHDRASRALYHNSGANLDGV